MATAGMIANRRLLGVLPLMTVLAGCAPAPGINVKSDPDSHLIVENTGIAQGPKARARICDDLRYHTITFDSHGTYAPISVNFSDDANETPPPCSQPAELSDYVKDIRERIDGASEIVFIVHGGLVSRQRGLSDALEALHFIKADPQFSDTRYPIFLNWYSGGLDAYREQLLNVREGQATWHTFAKVTAPIKLATDLATGVVAMPSSATLEGRRLSDLVFMKDELDDCGPEYAKDAPAVELVCPEGGAAGANLLERVTYPLATPVRVATAPVIQGPGRSAWENMKRRTQNPFWREKEDCVRGHDCLEKGDLQRLLEALGGDLRSKHVSIIGHSMGAIVANELIRELPNLAYRNIVFMGGAARISDVLKTVVPALRKNADSRFYNLTLLPSNEASEMTYKGLLPSGSLLEWIDEIYESPHSRLERTVGKWDNLRVLLPVLSEETGAHRITIKVFGSQPGEPMEHGDFNDVGMCFWRESFWGSRGSWGEHHRSCRELLTKVLEDHAAP
jgi:pimeloyl-ACP methyl ester carboxylesterase